MSSLKYSITNQSNNNQDYIYSRYAYKYSEVVNQNDKFIIKPKTVEYEFKTRAQVPKLGMLLVGIGGNNGTTVMGAIIANQMNIHWKTKRGEMKPNFYGSITQCSTTKIGVDENNKEIYLPLKDILPMVDPKDMIVHGWDISSMNMTDAMQRAQVFDYDLQQKLDPFMRKITPMPGIYYPDFIAANQGDRADHVLKGDSKFEHLETIRQNIREFKANNNLDKVIVLWTANTEKLTEIQPNINDTSSGLLNSIKGNHKDISPSTIYAVASILEDCSFINGSPQNTILPGVIELAEERGVFVAGNDFKSGQTKFKTMFTDFLVQAGIKPKAIVSYNHLGNNDGKNLSSEEQFKSKEKSKSSCVDDILYSNTALFKVKEDIDHCIVIKYTPSTGDTKKALDEYSSDIFMGGQHMLSCYNVCEDSLLASPIIIDLVLLTEIFERIEVKKENENWQKFDTILDSLGYLLKQPLTRESLPVINSLNRQRNCIENILKICAGIPLETNLLLERKLAESAKKINRIPSETLKKFSEMIQ